MAATLFFLNSCAAGQVDTTPDTTVATLAEPGVNRDSGITPTNKFSEVRTQKARPWEEREEARSLAHQFCRIGAESHRWFGVSERRSLPAGIYPNDRIFNGQLALTFDDGPLLPNTPDILATLRRLKLPATF
ncbi:MAG: polysaccharide deacetylase family protein, partial [Nannocystaceae bacterium]